MSARNWLASSAITSAALFAAVMAAGRKVDLPHAAIKHEIRTPKAENRQPLALAGTALLASPTIFGAPMLFWLGLARSGWQRRLLLALAGATVAFDAIELGINAKGADVWVTLKLMAMADEEDMAA